MPFTLFPARMGREEGEDIPSANNHGGFLVFRA